MSQLEQLEAELQLKYPQIYKELYYNNMLNWGETGPDWLENTFPTLQKNPPLLLYGNDIEIWDPIAYKAGILEIKNREVYDINPKFTLVPFAKSGAGDLYCFQFDAESNGEIPIVFLPHDDDQMKVLSKNFQDFIFRNMLEAVLEVEEGYNLFFDEDELQYTPNLLAQLKTHQPYLKPHWVSLLQEIFNREITEYSYTLPNGRKEEIEGLISEDEMNSILKNEIGFENLDKKITYNA